MGQPNTRAKWRRSLACLNNFLRSSGPNYRFFSFFLSQCNYLAFLFFFFFLSLLILFVAFFPSAKSFFFFYFSVFIFLYFPLIFLVRHEQGSDMPALNMAYLKRFLFPFTTILYIASQAFNVLVTWDFGNWSCFLYLSGKGENKPMSDSLTLFFCYSVHELLTRDILRPNNRMSR